jgi:hypothetical protein
MSARSLKKHSSGTSPKELQWPRNGDLRLTAGPTLDNLADEARSGQSLVAWRLSLRQQIGVKPFGGTEHFQPGDHAVLPVHDYHGLKALGRIAGNTFTSRL